MQKLIEKIIANETEMLAFGGHLFEVTPLGSVIYLQGDLGAGKTTLTRGFIQKAGHNGSVKSPTFTLVEPYEFLPSKSIFHFDLYRIHEPEELELMGIRDYFYEKSICLIEWPELGDKILPKADLICQIEINHKQRKITIIASTNKGEKILEQLV